MPPTDAAGTNSKRDPRPRRSGAAARSALDCWLAAQRLSIAHGVGFSALLAAVGDQPAALLPDPPRGIPAALREAIAAFEWAQLDADRAWLEDPGHALVRRVDPEYPAALRELADAPAALYLHGSADALTLPQVAVVGSRNPPAGGMATAADFAATLGRKGLVITSGLAAGIDAAAHRGALRAGATTIAVLGCGPDIVYPAAHRGLAAAVADGGALVSEYPPGTPPRRGHFPRRNRLIAALSLGVLVVEAGVRSGAQITARLAAEYGREVFAIPGSIHNPMARGCHQLIRGGARLVESVDDVLVEIAPQISALLAADDVPRAPAPDTGFVVSAEEGRVLDALGHDPVGFDTLVGRGTLTTAALSSILLRLEIHGLVRSVPGARYVRVP